MHLDIYRERSVDTDRKGRVKRVTFRLRFELDVSKDEIDAIRRNGLSNEVLFQSDAKIVRVDDLLYGDARWDLTALDTALSIETSMRENCEAFARYLLVAEQFEGRDHVPLAAG